MFGLPEWALGVAVIILAGSIGKAMIARYTPPGQLRGRKASKHEMAATVEDLQGKLGGLEDVEARLNELDDLQRRLADVEERLDFAERMLSQQRDAQRLSSPQK